MQETAQEQKEESVATATEEEASPENELAKVLEEKKRLEEIKAEMLAKEKAIQAEEDELHHRLASGLVESLMVRLSDFAKEFTKGKVFRDYEEIKKHLRKIQAHDANFPQSLAQNKYRNVNVKTPENQFWMHFLSSHIANNQLLHKFLLAALGRNEGPFVPKAKK